MQGFGRANRGAWHVGGGIEAGGTACTREGEGMPRWPMRDEIHAGSCVGVFMHKRVIYAFVIPERAKCCAIRICTQCRDIAGARTLPRGRDDEIRGVAAKPLQVITTNTVFHLVEFNHRLTDGKNVRLSKTIRLIKNGGL